jgi:O-antigen/teichoic acid export membrane protein/O-antigen ligase
VRIAETLRSRLQSRAGRFVVGTLAASGGLQLIVIISGVLVARSLGPEDRGYLALLIVISTVCAIAGTLGLPAAVTYYIAREPSQARRIASSLAWVGTGQLAAVFVVQAAALAAVVHSDPQRVQFAAAISLLLPPGILALSFGLAILQGQRRFTAYNVLRITPSTAYVGGVVVVFVSNATSLVLFMALWAGVNLIGGVIALIFALRGLPEYVEDDAAPSRLQMLRFGLKAFLGSLSPVDVVRLDQAVVGLFLTPVALGLYVVAQALANLPRVVATSIGFVAYPQVAAERDRASARRAMWRFFFLGLGLSAVVVGVLELMAGELITLFFGEEFTEATAIAQILLLASLFMAGRRVLTDGINGIGHPGYGTIAELTSWIFLLPGVAILLPWLGAEGVALALAISWGASFVLLLVLALAADRTSALGRGRLAETIRHLAVVPRPFQARQVLGLAGALIVAVLAGLAVAWSPTVGIGLVIALSAALLFAFGRRTLAERARALRRRVARPDTSVLDDTTDDGFAVPRRLYYGGVLLLGLLTLRVGGQVTFSDLLFLASFLLACAEFVILRRRVPIRLPFLLLIGIAIFSVGGLLSTFESYATTSSIAVIARLVVLTVFWFWLGTVVLRTQAHITRAMGFWVASAAICGGGAILQLLVGDVIPNASIDGGRATGFTSQPNDLGGLTAITFVPALMLASRARASVVRRAWTYASLLLVAAGLILSGSVGALIAAASAAAVWLALQRTSVHALLALATLAACVVALTALQSIRGAPHPLDRLESVTSSAPRPDGGTNQGSIEQRIGTYRVAIARIEEDPFVGVGLDLKSVTRPFGVESYEYDVHNLIIGLWYKTGLFGLVGMLIALFAILRSGWTAILGSSSSGESRLAAALASSFVAFVVFAMSEPVLFSRYGWISAALILALRGVQQEALASFEPTSRTGVAGRTVAASLRP